MDEKVFCCRRCGFCCHGETTVSLDEKDQERMLAALGISREDALRKYWRLSGSEIQMKTVDGHCVFYDNGCSIHMGRPWRCRQWPFVDAIITEQSNLEIIRNSCPGISKRASYQEICAHIRSGDILDQA